MNILWFEDNPWDVEVLTRQLQDQPGVRLHVVPRVQDGLRRLQQARFDLILLDLTLPDLEGLPVFLSVRAAAGATPIVVLTGWADPGLEGEVMARGAQDYLVKHEIGGRALARALRCANARRLQAAVPQQWLDLPALLEEQLLLTPAPGVQLIAWVDPCLPSLVEGDAFSLSEVLRSLLGNALRSTDRGYVGVSALCQPAPSGCARVRFVVEDSGPGIAPGLQASVWAVPELSLARSLVDSLGGGLRLESAPGCGSAFWFELDFVPVAPSQLAGRLQGRRVLLALPQTEVRASLAFALRRMGAETRSLDSEVDFLLALAEPWHDVLACAEWIDRAGQLRHDRFRVVAPNALARVRQLRELAGLREEAECSSIAF